MRKGVSKWGNFLFIMVVLSVFVSSAWGAARGPINSGETKNNIILDGSDTWTFEGNQYDRILITAVTVSGALNSCITLYPLNNPAEVSTCGFCDPHIGWSGGGDRLDHQLRNNPLRCHCNSQGIQNVFQFHQNFYGLL